MLLEPVEALELSELLDSLELELLVSPELELPASLDEDVLTDAVASAVSSVVELYWDISTLYGTFDGISLIWISCCDL